MYVLIGSQFEYITVMRQVIQPDPVSQRHFQSPTCRFSKNLDNLSPTSTPPTRAFKTQTRRKAVYQSITEAASPFCQHKNNRDSIVLDGDDPRRPIYGVYTSQVIRSARVFSHVTDFNARNKSLTAKLLQQGY